MKNVYKGGGGKLNPGPWTKHNWTIKRNNIYLIYLCYNVLFFRAAVIATSMNFFDYVSGNTTFVLDDVRCTGSETSLVQCDRRQWGEHDCYTSKIAGVICASNGESRLCI